MIAQATITPLGIGSKQIIDIYTLDDCFCVVDMYDGSAVIDFTQQCQESLKNSTDSQQIYEKVKSYFKWGEMQQERAKFTVSIKVL